VKRLLGFRREKIAERRRHERRARLEDGIRRREAWIAENDRLIARLRDQIDELEAEIASAWTESWAERQRSRVQEKYGKIAALEERNAKPEAEISEIRAKA